jgi:hypothetical protein
MLTVSVIMIIIAATIGSGALVATFSWLLYRLRRLELEGSDSRRVAALNQEVATLRDELDIAQGSIDRLAERLDFTERLLTRGSTSEDDVEGDASR